MKKSKSAGMDSRHPPDGYAIVRHGSVKEGDLMWSGISERWVLTLLVGKRLSRMTYLIARKIK